MFSGLLIHGKEQALSFNDEVIESDAGSVCVVEAEGFNVGLAVCAVRSRFHNGGVSGRNCRSCYSASCVIDLIAANRDLKFACRISRISRSVVDRELEGAGDATDSNFTN